MAVVNVQLTVSKLPRQASLELTAAALLKSRNRREGVLVKFRIKGYDRLHRSTGAEIPNQQANLPVAATRRVALRDLGNTPLGYAHETAETVGGLFGGFPHG